MPFQILALGFLGLGLLAATAFAFYRQGQKNSRLEKIRLQARVESLTEKLQSETERANRAVLRLERFKQEKLYRHDKQGRISRFQPGDEFLSEG